MGKINTLVGDKYRKVRTEWGFLSLLDSPSYGEARSVVLSMDGVRWRKLSKLSSFAITWPLEAYDRVTKRICSTKTKTPYQQFPLPPAHSCELHVFEISGWADG